MWGWGAGRKDIATVAAQGGPIKRGPSTHGRAESCVDDAQGEDDEEGPREHGLKGRRRGCHRPTERDAAEAAHEHGSSAKAAQCGLGYHGLDKAGIDQGRKNASVARRVRASRRREGRLAGCAA